MNPEYPTPWESAIFNGRGVNGISPQEKNDSVCRPGLPADAKTYARSGSAAGEADHQS